MVEQQSRSHRPDMFNHVQRDEGFAGIHAGLKSFKLQVASEKNNLLRPFPKTAGAKSFLIPNPHDIKLPAWLNFLG
jgi:hypothetical protein